MAAKKIDAGEIQIEDPLDFLTPAEKKEYIRAHQDTLLRSEEDMRRIREATEDPRVSHRAAAYEEDDALEMEDLYEEEETPAGKPYVYQDTRLHTDERRSRAGKEARVRKPAARARVAYAGEAASYAEDEVEDTAFDYMLSVAMKAFLAAILIVGLIIAYMIYVRPLIRRATGLAGQAVQTGTRNEDDADETNAPAQGTEQEGTPRPAAPADGETVITTTQLNLRTAPNTETSEVVRTVPAGTRITRLSDDGEWSKILIDGQELFCASRYLEAE